MSEDYTNEDILYAIVPDSELSKQELHELELMNHANELEYTELRKIKSFLNDGYAKMKGLELLSYVNERREEAEVESRTDALTGLNNRNGIVESVNQIMAYNERHNVGQKALLLVIDADDFKGINSNYGYCGGDKALQHIANGLYQNVRKTDIVGRYGGDEFVAILPQPEGISRESADKLVDILRRDIQREKVTTADGESFRAYVSIGYPQDSQGNPVLYNLEQFQALGTEAGRPMIESASNVMVANKIAEKKTRKLMAQKVSATA